ncbi:uncharacterized protein LOC136027389 isoform X2 [Artemia franciscana]|uniref:uncharacterized protein LOC136027389 isoform X2 n=1 Tax=Artemia franciscana TaxID=6661 RepID=UPI0032D9CB67
MLKVGIFVNLFFCVTSTVIRPSRSQNNLAQSRTIYSGVHEPQRSLDMEEKEIDDPGNLANEKVKQNQKYILHILLQAAIAEEGSNTQYESVYGDAKELESRYLNDLLSIFDYYEHEAVVSPQKRNVDEIDNTSFSYLGTH